MTDIDKLKMPETVTVEQALMLVIELFKDLQKERDCFRTALCSKNLYCDQIEKEMSREIRYLKEQLSRQETK